MLCDILRGKGIGNDGWKKIVARKNISVASKCVKECRDCGNRRYYAEEFTDG